MKLTDTAIKKAKSAVKPYKVSDGKGLFLWITPSGGKSGGGLSGTTASRN
jgi:hypothetical protein